MTSLNSAAATLTLALAATFASNALAQTAPAKPVKPLNAAQKATIEQGRKTCLSQVDAGVAAARAVAEENARKVPFVGAAMAQQAGNAAVAAGASTAESARVKCHTEADAQLPGAKPKVDAASTAASAPEERGLLGRAFDAGKEAANKVSDGVGAAGQKIKDAHAEAQNNAPARSPSPFGDSSN